MTRKLKYYPDGDNATKVGKFEKEGVGVCLCIVLKIC